MSDKLKAFEVVYSFDIPQPGSTTIPALTEEDAKKKLLEIMSTAKNIVVTEVHDIETLPAFKTMVAAQVINAENEQKAFQRWLDEAAKEDEIEDAEVVSETKVLN